MSIAFPRQDRGRCRGKCDHQHLPTCFYNLLGKMALVPPPGLRGSQCPVRRQRLSHTNGGQRNPRSLLATFVRRWQTSQTQVVVQEIYIIEFLSYGSTFKRTEVKKGDRNSRSGNEAQEPLAELRKIYFPISYFIALNSLSKILTTVRRDNQWGVVYQKRVINRDTLKTLRYELLWVQLILPGRVKVFIRFGTEVIFHA